MKNILTIIISTYNRAELLKNNLEKMLAYNLDVNFIVGDNASTDKTWDILSKINNDRLRIYRNNKNLDINNVFLLAGYVETQYFIFLNDRDFIEKESLVSLLRDLKDTNYEMIASVFSNIYKKGEINTSTFYYLYFLANHPGCLIYSTHYFANQVDATIIKKRALEHDSEFIYNYVTFQILMNLNHSYFRPCSMIVQPRDRDRIVQTRKEQYGSAYILPEYHIKAFDSRIILLDTYSDKNKKIDILFALFKSSLRKVELEFYVSSKSEDFCIRNHCVGVNSRDWLRNGVIYTRGVINNKRTKKYLSKVSICIMFLRETFLNYLRILKMR